MEGKAATALSHGTKVNGIGSHFRHGDLRRNHLLAGSGGVHSHDAAPALVQISDDVAHVAVGHGDLQLAYRLQQNRIRLRHGGLISQLRRGLKGDFRGIHRMIGAVVQNRLQIYHGIARQRTVNTGLPQTLFHGREEVLGYGAAENLLRKDHLFRLGIRLEANPHIAELAAAAGLLLVAALLLDGFADLFPIGNPGGLQLRLHIEPAFKLTHQDVNLHIAGAGQHHLMGLGVIGNGKGGILLVQLVQALGNLVLLPAGLGHNGHGIAGLREGDALQRNHLPGIAEGIAGLDPFHLADGADVAAAQLLDLHGLLAPHHVQAAQLLAGAGAAVHHGQIRPDFPGQHLDKGVLAVLVGNRLEHKRRGHAAGRNHEFLRLPVLLGGLVVIALHGIGQQIHNVIHQHQGTQAVDSGAAQHREQA